MPEHSWLIAMLVGLFLVLFVFVRFIRKRPAPQESGRRYIRRQLQKHRIADEVVSDDCISELVDIAISSAEIEAAAGSKFKKSFHILLDSMIDVVLIWRSDPEDTMFQPIGDEVSMFREIMERHKVPTAGKQELS